MSNELRAYVQSEQSRGITSEVIRSALLAQGWDSKVIDAAFSEKSSFTSEKRPILVLIISWLLFLGGILQGLGGVMSLGLAALFGGIALVYSLAIIMIAVGLIVLSFGLRRMRRWALYLLTVLTALGVAALLYGFIFSEQIIPQFAIGVLLQAAAVTYFWVIRDRFTRKTM